MAGNPPAGDSRRKSQKRAAGKDDEGQETKRQRSWNPFASSEPKFDPEADAGSPTPSPPPATAEEREEHQRRVARAVDADFAAREAKQLIRTMEETNDPFNPDIKPIDEEWIELRKYIVAQLKDAKTPLLEALEEFGIEGSNFKALQLIPPPTRDLVLELQEENTKLYKKAMGPGGTFEGINDNFATKITMLHFGLPIEPLTEQNVKNCQEDLNDPPDDEPGTPRVQSIFYSEKPLQFLDLYHERSFGFLMLRRPEMIPQEVSQPVPLGHDAIGHRTGHHRHARLPVQPTGDVLGMRGGAGVSSDRYLYSRYGASIKLKAIDNEVSADDFREAALKALDLHPDSAWTIVVDQFNNTEQYKSDPAKPHLRSFIVHSHDFKDKYESYLKTRISNRLQDWCLAVDYYHLRLGDKKNTEPLIIPTRSRNGKDILDLTKLPKDRPQNHKDATNLPALALPVETSSNQATRELYAYPGGASQPFKNDSASFAGALRKLFPSSSEGTMSISIYSKQLDKTTESTGAPLDHTLLPFATRARRFLDIPKRAFQETGWIVVAHHMTTRAPSFWPPSGGAPTAAQIKRPRFLLPTPFLDAAPIYRNKEASLTAPVASDFSKHALGLLGIDPMSAWDFAVDFYSNRSKRVGGASPELDFSHYVHIRKASLEKQFVDDIEPRLFRGEKDWAVVVRLTDEQPASNFTPFEVLPNPANKFSYKGAGLTSPVSSTGRSFIYGYGGQIQVEKTAAAFQAGALALLGLANVNGWTFTVDLHDTSPPKSITLSASTIANRFEKSIKNISGDHNYPWPVFVRKCLRISTRDLAPPDTVNNYVILKGPDRQSYWKLPNALEERYGMNQIQNSFFEAMLVHYPLSSPRPSQDVNFNTSLGYGGIEITKDFWDTITHRFRELRSGFIVCRGIPRPNPDPNGEVGIRLAGTHRYRTFKRGDFTGLAEGVRQLSQISIFNRAKNQTSSPPTMFRAWFTAEDREDNVSSEAFYYDDKDSQSSNGMNLADSLKTFFQATGTKKSTNCIWFRPEWKRFTVIENDPPPSLDNMEVDQTNQLWDVTADGPNLSSFRGMLALVFDDDAYEHTHNFEINIPQASQQFVVNFNTAEEEWRKHVFDYFHDNTLLVKRSHPIIAVRDSGPWGILDMPSSIKAVAAVPHRRTVVPPQTLYVENAHSHGHTHHRVDTNNNGNDYGGTSSCGVPPPVVQPLYRDRRIPGAKPPIFRTTDVPKFDKWMLNHTAQNNLQQRSWSQDQSVIEPGYEPAAPLYGDNLELAITVGSSMPTVFVQHLTPTDIIQLRKENRKLLNHALEREIGCPICNVTFKAYDNDAKSAHFKSHMEQLSSVGNCPFCNEHWAFFTWAQKKDHLLADFARQESQDIDQFWEDVRCPICNLDFRGSSAEDVTTHIASHVPGALKFCDRCGFKVLACTPPEKAHHDRVCTRKTPVRECGAPDPIICQNCGRERTPASEKRREHDVCGNGQFCIRCGLNLALIDVQERHEHFKRCRVPGGNAGKYCKRCGKNLSSLSTHELASHNNECYTREPVSVAADAILENGLSPAVEAQRIRNAAERADLLRRDNELRAQETVLLALEKEILRRESHPYDIEDHGYVAALSAPAASGQVVQNHFQQHTDDAQRHELGVDRYDMRNCPISGCGFRLGANSRQTVRDHFETHSGLVPSSVASSDSTHMGHCPVNKCQQVLGNMTRRQMVNHFTTHTAGNKTSDPVTFQCPFTVANGQRCSERLSLAKDASELLDHYHHHGEQDDGLPACHSAALNASLAEFKRRLPEFRDAHAILQKIVDNSVKPGARPNKEHAAIITADNLLESSKLHAAQRLKVKKVKEEYRVKSAWEAIRRLGSDVIRLRAELAEAEEADAAVGGAAVLDSIIEAQNKVHEAENALAEATSAEYRRSSEAAKALWLEETQLNERKSSLGYPVDLADNVAGTRKNDDSAGGGGPPGGRAVAGGGDESDEAGEQKNLHPSPARSSFKNPPTPRRARSVKQRAAPIATGSKRKKAAMDDSEDTMSGGFANLVRSPSKRETKKMRVAGGRMVAGSEVTRRRLGTVQQPGEGDGGAGDGAGVGMSDVPRRATRAAGGVAPRKVGRPRKVAQEEIEVDEAGEDDDGFEDVVEEDEGDEGYEGGETQMPVKDAMQMRARK